jgi:hypothetical protein
MKFLTTTLRVAVFALFLFLWISGRTQSIGTFNPITPTAQTQSLVIPASHKFQRIIKSGDALSLGGTLGANPDFTGYVPIAGSSRNGYLSISNEVSASADVAILGIQYNFTTKVWNVTSGGNVFNSTVVNQIGVVSRFCSGTVTPDNRIMVSEEDVTAGDANADGYTDRGWIIEIDPATRTVVDQGGAVGPDKLWAIGRTNRENVVIKSDRTALYTGADDGTLGYLYKFVPTVAGNFSAGTLYVFDPAAANGLGSGTWRVVANGTQAERNSIRTASQTAGGFNYNGIEDVEIGPDGKIYFTAKSEGKIYRFTDNGTYGQATDVTGMEVFAGNDAYPTIKSYDVDPGAPVVNEPWGRGNDNLAFDGEGNLWVCQDAIVASDRNHIWVISPGHTQASPQVRVFATTPTRSESTGITFTPDYKFMFISFMNPTTSNSTAQTDAAGNSVVFNTHTTVVIARSENLGSTATLPVSFASFSAKQQLNAVAVKWSVENITGHQYFAIERSTDGVNFFEIGRNNENINGETTKSFTYMDNSLPAGATVLYYRIKQCDIDDKCSYTQTETIRLNGKGQVMQVYPQPVNDQLNVVYNSLIEGQASIVVTDINGRNVIVEKRNISKGVQTLLLDTHQLTSGMYMMKITDKNSTTTQKFMKH